MNRPSCVTIVGILQLISGLFNLFDGLVLLLLGGLSGGLGAAIGGQAAVAVGALFGGVLMIFALISLVLGLISLLLSMGLFRMQKWAWIGAVVVQIITLLTEGTKLIGSGGLAVNFLTLGFASVIFYYLMRPDLKQAFGV